jgi:hypothetical protein
MVLTPFDRFGFKERLHGNKSRQGALSKQYYHGRLIIFYKYNENFI